MCIESETVHVVLLSILSIRVHVNSGFDDLPTAAREHDSVSIAECVLSLRPGTDQVERNRHVTGTK